VFYERIPNLILVDWLLINWVRKVECMLNDFYFVIYDIIDLGINRYSFLN